MRLDTRAAPLLALALLGARIVACSSNPQGEPGTRPGGSGVAPPFLSCGTATPAQSGAPDPVPAGGFTASGATLAVGSLVVRCKVASDCGLPRSICVSGRSGQPEQGVFTDPTCESGYCHWLMLEYACGSSCSAGACCAEMGQTTGPSLYSPTGQADLAGPAQSCNVPGDCALPPPKQVDGMYGTVTACYSHPSCNLGSCGWQVDLATSAAGCAGLGASPGAGDVAAATDAGLDASDASRE